MENQLDFVRELICGVFEPWAHKRLVDPRGEIWVYAQQDEDGRCPGRPLPMTLTGNRLRPPSVLAATHYSTAIFRGNPRSGRCSWREPERVAMWCLALDDVGAKVEPNPIAPTYRVETRPGNEQWVYVFEHPLRDNRLAKAITRKLAKSDVRVTDQGGQNPGRMVRLPMGKPPGKPTPARLMEMDLDRRFDPQALLDRWGVGSVKNSELAPELRAVELAARDDPWVLWLYAAGVVVGAGGEGWLEITCPWGDTHTDGGVTAGYRVGTAGGGFHCFHDHCRGKRASDFRGALMARLGAATGGVPSGRQPSPEELARMRELLTPAQIEELERLDGRRPDKYAEMLTRLRHVKI